METIEAESVEALEVNPHTGKVVERDEFGRLMKGSTAGRPIQAGEVRGVHGGRKRLSTLLVKLMEKEVAVSPEGIFKHDPYFKNKNKLTIEECINLALIAQAAKGDVKAIALVYDRLEGKADQKLDVEQYGDLKISWAKPALEESVN